MKAKLLVLLLMMAAPKVFAAPQYPEARLQFAINNQVNDKLSSIVDPIIPRKPIEIKANQEGVMDMYIQMTDVEILGVEDFTSTNSKMDIRNINNTIFNIDITSPKVTLNAGHYFMNGSMVDHIELFGEGPGMISVDKMNIKLKGDFSITRQKSLSLVFHEAVLDLEMLRWTVDFEGIMPGTDLGTVFNEFFTMCGPEIFDTVENKINSSGKLLTFLNGLFPPDSGEGSEVWDADAFLDRLVSAITLSHHEN